MTLSSGLTSLYLSLSIFTMGISKVLTSFGSSEGEHLWGCVSPLPLLTVAKTLPGSQSSSQLEGFCSPKSMQSEWKMQVLVASTSGIPPHFLYSSVPEPSCGPYCSLHPQIRAMICASLEHPLGHPPTQTPKAAGFYPIVHSAYFFVCLFWFFFFCHAA